MMRTFGVVFLVVSMMASGCSEESPATAPVQAAEPPAEAASEGPFYVGSENCATCHSEQHAKWAGCHHEFAMQPATAETVVGDFSGTSFEYAGTRYAFLERDGTYIARADDENGALTEFEITHTFGIDPLQQCLISFPDGRLQALSVA